ncbi:GNAT family N-acetyltransferase [Rossellomorea vietnamensis]|uniref:GNAT family N-acetyltransferase n=1 Tax=Rossellomorea vietnamensis TaxID=218284 RepID=A0A5D4MBM6_9BACI|nr:GNAT family N-acetyltransferase [Rossellomorea vietnamensis]TYR99254.1 GNAT family N-acetyltransferase [Rossellomorea vietnamensis]
MNIQRITDNHREKVKSFFTAHWGSPEMVISSGVYDCSELDGFCCDDESKEITGLITYKVEGEKCEIISLDSIEEGKGIGSALLHETERAAAELGCTSVQLVTTNDNIEALRFYQKRGYFLSNLFINAVEKARKIKPKIPLIGNTGIPIRDEIEMRKDLL